MNVSPSQQPTQACVLSRGEDVFFAVPIRVMSLPGGGRGAWGTLPCRRKRSSTLRRVRLKFRSGATFVQTSRSARSKFIIRGTKKVVGHSLAGPFRAMG